MGVDVETIFAHECDECLAAFLCEIDSEAGGSRHSEHDRNSAGERDSTADESLRLGRLSWFWTCMMGSGMLVGGLLALVLLAGHVVAQAPAREQLAREAASPLEEAPHARLPSPSLHRLAPFLR